MSESARLERLRAAWPSTQTAREAVLADGEVRGAGRRGTVWMVGALGATLAWAIPLSVIGDMPLRSGLAQVLGMAFAAISMVLMVATAVCVAMAAWNFTRPRRQLRRTTFTMYAAALGLDFSTRDRAVTRRGIFFGEPHRERGYLGDAYIGKLCLSDEVLDPRKKRLRIGGCSPPVREVAVRAISLVPISIGTCARASAASGAAIDHEQTRKRFGARVPAHLTRG